MRRTAFALLLAFVSSGCLRSTTVIDLAPDGSGTIVQETGLSSQALAMMKSFAGNQPGNAPPDLFSEEQARKAASTMGVRFVSGEPFKTADLEGYRARFAFDDISQIKVTMQEGAAAIPGGDSRQPPFSFTFDRGPTSSLLTINMPDQAPGKPGSLPALPGATGSEADKAQAAQALSMMKTMMKGLFVDVSLNVNGRILKSNAPYVQGSRVTLMQIDFDKLLADEASLLKLQSASDLKSLSAVPGLKIPSEPKVVVEIAR